MADNPPASQGGPRPPLPSSGTTGRLKSPTTQLPIKKGGAGKIVVMLSSVAKPPPAVTQSLTPLPATGAPPKIIPGTAAPVEGSPPPLPPKQVAPANQPSSGKLSTTTYVKLPAKASVPHWTSLSGKSDAIPAATPPPLPLKKPEVSRSGEKKPGAQHIPPIKLNTPDADEGSPAESIFPKSEESAAAPKPEGWKSLEAGELNPPAGGLQSLDVFAKSQRILYAPAPVTPVPKDPASPFVAPALIPPVRSETPISAARAIQAVKGPLLPPPVEKAVETPPLQPIHVAPPMVEKAHEAPREKLPPPHLPEVRKSEGDSDGHPAPGVHKVPALIEPDPSASATSPKPLLPPASAKGPASWLKKTMPLVLSSTAKVAIPNVAETKPALKPPILPKRSLLTPAAPVEDTRTDAPKSEGEALTANPKTPVVVQPDLPLPQPSVISKSPLPLPEVAQADDALKLPPPAIPFVPGMKAPPPETRVARSKKRRRWELIIFWALIVPLTVATLFLGSLYFGRDTRIEGQAIPPPGTALNDEVWIVTNFSSEVSGIAEDLAAERTPLMQEIQERQQHVQRVQADIASREERIRLIQQDIQADKDEIVAVVKKARDDTQQIWDGEGAEIDRGYQEHFDQLKQAIAARAKSLNLKYAPDDTFQSPEVWANAYRLALYEVPPGVDSVKEHEWLGTQMKQWRDYLKTLDDRKEQLREKAAQIKLAPAPKITDLNSKIDDLQQRIDATTSEEVPLKAELQQAQSDLAQAQAADAGLDDKYYKELYGRPEANITKRIHVLPNGRFTWLDDNPFIQGEKAHHYWLFVRATRADGRQYWALHHFNISKNQTIQMVVEPTGFISTKAILRPNLTPEEQEQ
jgi:hypothetical protein